jgi:hypothetical protein
MLSTAASKRCTRCSEEKPVESFSKDSKSKSGLQAWCRSCMAEWRKSKRATLTKKELSQLAAKRREYVRMNPQLRSNNTAEYLREWRKTNPGKQRQYTLKHKYGLTPEVYQAISFAQGGVCAIPGCGGTPTQVDHDHSCCSGPKSCGACVRGILCKRCNIFLGAVKDNSVLLRGMLSYLRKVPVPNPNP